MEVSDVSTVELAHAVCRLIREAPENRLDDYDGQAVFKAPLIGVADGDDPLFERFREVVSPRHLLPRGLLQRHSPRGTDLTRVTVVVWVLPFSERIRQSNRCHDWPSKLYSLARNNGGALNYALRLRLTRLLNEWGWAAVAPLLEAEYDAFRSSRHTFTSSWSERHVAYAAGLGQFGLNGSLITSLGANVRLGSLVTNLPLEPTPRPYGTHRAPCLELGGQGCGVCIERCPVGAISTEGLDKSKCYVMRNAVRERHMDRYTRDLHMLRVPIVKSGKRQDSYSLGCALCQCGVPCEGCSPWNALDGREVDA
jgi:epoxyqueuosine reductase